MYEIEMPIEINEAEVLHKWNWEEAGKFEWIKLNHHSHALLLTISVCTHTHDATQHNYCSITDLLFIACKKFKY